MSAPAQAVHAQTASRLDANRLLQYLAWARLVFAQLLLVTAPLIPEHLAPDYKVGMVAMTQVITVLSSAALLFMLPFSHPRRIGWLICVLDVAVVTAVVAATGGPRSIYPFLYVLSVIAACLLLPRTGALSIAAIASVLYIGLVFARTVLPATLFQPLYDITSLDVLTMFLNSGTLLVVAIAAGGLAERIRSAGEALETQRKDLEDLQAFREVILRSVGAGLILVDRNNLVTGLNRVAEEITGRRASDAIGRPSSLVFGDIPISAMEAALAQHPMTPSRYEATLHRPDGTRVPVRMTFSALRSGQGGNLGLILVCEDLSEIRQMEDRMRRADRLATVGRLAANIAHEIRNPLASLTGAIEALTGYATAPDEREKLTRIVSRESERLNELLSNFLEYARPAPMSLETVDIAAIIEEVLTLLEHRELPPGLKVARALPPALLWRVDPQLLRQALWNLCLNAVDAMPNGGELSVAARIEGETLKILVSDTGDGIAPSDIPHLFEPFFSTKPAGGGLGLALVHRILRDHAGDIEVRTQPGAGTTFVMTMPSRHA